MSIPELEALSVYLNNNVPRGFIKSCHSEAEAAVLFIKKSDRSLKFYENYRGLNEGILKNRYPILLLPETLIHLDKVKWFLKLDLCKGYY